MGLSQSNPKHWNTLQDNKQQKKYDFIVCGSGSSGGVIARRLAEANYQVLLLEAGGNDGDKDVQVPLAMSKVQGTHMDWKFKTTKQKIIGKGMEEGHIKFPRAKVLGGCSSMNYHAYVRPHRWDCDHWAELCGDDVWKYEKNGLRWLKKSEKATVPTQVGDLEYHSTEGLWETSQPRNFTKATELLIQASHRYGLKFNPDYNGKDMNGSSFMTSTITQNALRNNIPRAFLRSDGYDKECLDVQMFAHVTKILINDKKEAYGVEYVFKGKKCTVTCTKEVIVSAGAIQSPQILLLSGIGSKEQLDKFNIPLIKDLPGVGENLQDHPIAPITYETTIETVTEHSDTLHNLYLYFLKSQGIFMSPGLEATLFYNSGLSKHLPKEVPDTQLMVFIATIGIQDYKNFGFKKSFWENAKRKDHKHGISIIPTIAHPLDSGRVTLNSSDPFDKPKIELHYLESKEDQEKMILGLKKSYEIFHTEPLKSIVTKYAPIGPGNPHPEGSYEFFKYIMTNFTSTVYHPCGTCKMSKDDDPMGVVSSRLKVRGITNLRVADASIMPHLTTGNTAAPCVMIGEACAEFILEQHGENPPRKTSSTPNKSNFWKWLTTFGIASLSLWITLQYFPGILSRTRS